jgi:hypothetical protein
VTYAGSTSTEQERYHSGILENLCKQAKMIEHTSRRDQRHGPADPTATKLVAEQWERDVGIGGPYTAALAANHQLPSIGPVELVANGGQMGYGVNFPETFRRAQGHQARRHPDRTGHWIQGDSQPPGRQGARHRRAANFTVRSPTVIE